MQRPAHDPAGFAGHVISRYEPLFAVRQVLASRGHMELSDDWQ
jgi:hypothetical protein